MQQCRSEVGSGAPPTASVASMANLTMQRVRKAENVGIATKTANIFLKVKNGLTREATFISPHETPRVAPHAGDRGMLKGGAGWRVR